MKKFYLLEGDEVVLCPDIDVWVEKMTYRMRILRKDWIAGAIVTTSFLGFDAVEGVRGFDAPRFFSTNVLNFPNPGDDVGGGQYSTKADAIAGHERWLARIRYGDRCPLCGHENKAKQACCC